MSYTRVCIHYVWATKNRMPVLTSTIRNSLFIHIRRNAEDKKIMIDALNGHIDHVHCLVWLQVTQSIDQIAKLLKGESAHWFNNRSGISKMKLQWQENYFAASVSESMMPVVRGYILNQELHHQKITFNEAYTQFFNNYNFEDL